MSRQRGSPYGEAGQILLIVILVVIVASTIGLSLASRSITTLRSSAEEAQAQKALAAAEAGIERVAQGNVPVAISNGASISLGNNASFKTQVDEIKGNQILLNGGNIIPKDEGADFWLSTYDSDPNLNYGGTPWSGNLTIYWGSDSDPCKNSALEIIIVSGPKAAPVAKKYAFDPCGSRQGGNHFSSNVVAGTTLLGMKFSHSASIDVSSALISRIIPIYVDTSIGLAGRDTDPAFPTQGYVINSTGTSGEANRVLRVFKGWPQAYLPYLSYGLFVPAN